MASDDLRNCLAKVGSAGEPRRINGADWDLEMTHFVDPKVSGNFTSAFLSDDIKGYPSGYRVAIPRLVTPKQTALTLNLAEDSQMELVNTLWQRWPQWDANLNQFLPKSCPERTHLGPGKTTFGFGTCLETSWQPLGEPTACLLSATNNILQRR